MSGLCGWFSDVSASPVDRRTIATMAAPLGHFDGSTVRTAVADFGAVAASGHNVSIHQEDRMLVAIWGSTRFLDPDLAELAQREGDARALAWGYVRKGMSALNDFSGACAFAILDRHAGQAIVAVDRMGVRPLCYCTVGRVLVFGSSLDAIRGFSKIDGEINPQSIYDYVYFHMVPAPFTILAGCRRLLPGTCLVWRDGETDLSTYWEMTYIEDEERPLAELKTEFLTALRRSVREAAQDGVVGTFLSGGTDSSTVAGILGEITGKPARTYSIGFEAQGYDEMHYARIAARHFRTQHHEYYVTPEDVVNAVPRIAEVHDQPFGNSSAVPSYFCARLAKYDGVDILLGGDGGDELFGGNERYAQQYIYSLYSDLPPFLRNKIVEPFVFAFPQIGIFGKAQRYIRHASLPMPARYNHYNLVERLGDTSVFTSEFLATVDPGEPREVLASAYSKVRARSLINRMLAMDLRFTLADNDLPKVTRSCELAAVEARFPMLDDILVSFSAILPPDLKLRGGRLRYFFKESLRGFLPDEIIVKKKHGFGLPFGPWLRTHRLLRDLALDSLAALKKRNIVRSDFIDDLVSIHVEHHARYYSTMVWILMMLEQWFRRDRPSLERPEHAK